VKISKWTAVVAVFLVVLSFVLGRQSSNKATTYEQAAANKRMLLWKLPLQSPPEN